MLVAAEAGSAAEGSGTSEAGAIALEAVDSEVCDICRFFAGDDCRDRCRVIMFDGGGSGLGLRGFLFFGSVGFASEATLEALVVPETLEVGEEGAIGALSSGAALDEVSGGGALAVVLGGATLGSSGGGKPVRSLNNALGEWAEGGGRGGDGIGFGNCICDVWVVDVVDVVDWVEV